MVNNKVKKLPEFGLMPPIRRGMGAGKGRGYYNIVPYDSYVHYLAGKGVKSYQPVFSQIPLEHKPLELTLYIPSTQGEKKVVSEKEFDKRISEAERKMSNLFGGYTQVDASGGWVGETGLVREPVAKVTSFTDVKDFEKNKKQFEKYVDTIRRKYQQDTMSIEFEGDLYFYKPQKKKRGKLKTWKVKVKEKDDYLWEHNGLFASVTTVQEWDGKEKEYVFQVFNTNTNKRILDQTFSSEKVALKYAKKYMTSHDTDEDGVPDTHDCNPFNPLQQDMDDDAKVGLDRLKWYSTVMATPPTFMLRQKNFDDMIAKFPSPDRDKDGIPDALDLEVKRK